jgi:hypothetical protein
MRRREPDGVEFPVDAKDGMELDWLDPVKVGALNHCANRLVSEPLLNLAREAALRSAAWLRRLLLMDVRLSILGMVKMSDIVILIIMMLLNV